MKTFEGNKQQTTQHSAKHAKAHGGDSMKIHGQYQEECTYLRSKDAKKTKAE